MTTTIKVFEVTGIAGTPTFTEITNVNFKNSAGITDKYYYYPLRRPDLHNDLTYSYTKWIYFTVHSTSQIKNLSVIIGEPNYDNTVYDGATDDASGSQLFYKLSNTYVQPDGSADHSMTFVHTTPIEFYPFVSTASPAAATSHIVTLNANVTYFTNYLVLQKRVHYSADIEDAKNGKSYGFQFKFDTF